MKKLVLLLVLLPPVMGMAWLIFKGYDPLPNLGLEIGYYGKFNQVQRVVEQSGY